jgi:NitT/TauT family transport system ATP-binding protein
MAPSLVALQHVGKTFVNGLTALEDVNFDVSTGEFLSLLGPSGCGKSTVLRIIAGLAVPTAGKVVWADGASASARDIGFVFQEPTLMPWAPVAANVSLPLRLAHADKRATAERVDEVLASVGLTDFRQAYPRELSGGMKMRVSIARALVTRPKLLLMDEPFAALDEITRFKLNNDMRELWRTLGTTIVFVTHSVFESVFLSNRVAVMTSRPGRVFCDVNIDAPERDEQFRTSPEYASYCRQVSEALGTAMISRSGA